MRGAVPGIPDADALPAIVAGAGLPIIADIHFNASLALRAMDTGVAAVRINPGNIGGADKVERSCEGPGDGNPAAHRRELRSLPDHLRPRRPPTPPAPWSRPRWRRSSCSSGSISAISRSPSSCSSVPAMIEAYRRLAARGCPIRCTWA